MEETTQTLNKYFTPKHIVFYLIIIPAITTNYLIFNQVLNNAENLNILFNIKELLTLLIYFSISLSFAGIALYFLKRTYELAIISLLLTAPILGVNLSIDQTLIATFASLVTFFLSGLILRNKTQKYIVPNLREQISSSFKLTTLLLNFSLTFIFYTQVSFIGFDTWIGNINYMLAPITEAVTKEVEKTLLPQKQFITQAQNLIPTNLFELDINQLEKAISINEIGGFEKSQMLSLDELLATPSPTDIIKSELKTLLTPYQQFLPLIAALIAFINYQVVINLSILLSSFLITILVYLLKLFKVINIKKEMREISTYEI